MTESIGAALRKRREQRQLTLQQVSEATRIRVHALQALENDDISAMPSAAQARGFMRIYATFLELDLEALIPPSGPPAPANAPAAPVKDAALPPASRATTADAGPAAPGLLADLRDHLARRFGNRPPVTDANRSVEPGLGPESEGKKKALR